MDGAGPLRRPTSSSSRPAGSSFATSTLGRRTTFHTLYFPAQCPTARPPRPAGGDGPPSERADDDCGRRGGPTVLEDARPPVRAFASRSAPPAGAYTVLEAESGRGRRRHARRARNRPVDVFVTDVVMPGKRTARPGLRGAVGTARHPCSSFVSRAIPRRGGRRTTPRSPNSLFLAKPFSLTAMTDIVARGQMAAAAASI